MLKLIVGNKGAGKTKILLDMLEASVGASSGVVVFVDKTDQRKFDLPHKIRLVAADNYHIEDVNAFYGLFAGLMAGNYDITDIYVDSTLKITGRDYDKVAEFFEKMNQIATDTNIVFTVSEDRDKLPESISKFVIN